jgi:hypothetical protein
MMALGSLGFLSPFLLAGLLALPAIWWLLRMTPPRPNEVVFPPTRLLKDIETTEETPAHSPWWLTLLRMILAALVILALAKPVLNPDREALGGSGPLLLVFDNGWGSGAGWERMREAAESYIGRAERDDRTVILAPTASREPVADPVAAGEARERLEGVTPLPYAPDREGLARRLEEKYPAASGMAVVWLSDGLDHGGASVLTPLLEKLGALTVLRPGAEEGPLAMRASSGRGELGGTVLNPLGGAREGMIQAVTAKGERLAEAPFSIPAGQREGEASLALPLEIRNQTARLEIAGERSAGAVSLLDARSRWRRIGIISGEAQELNQPLLSPLYYVERALGPFADIVPSRDPNLASAVGQIEAENVTTLILADVGKLPDEAVAGLRTFLDGGGVLVRFAGPKLEQGGDELMPVTLRAGGRSLGGSLSWSTPQPLAPFEDGGPFSGLAIPGDVTVNRQVLADPAALGAAQVWARLADGTPLVTARAQGDGWLILFHVTANSDWSNLPLSGLFVEMLRRISAIGGEGGASPTDGAALEMESGPRVVAADGALAPLQTLDGFGRLGAPPARATAIDPSEIDNVRAGPEHPPGYYGPSGAPRAVNLIRDDTELAPLGAAETGASARSYAMQKPVPLDSWMLIAALVLFLADVIATLWLASGWRPWRRAAPQAAAVALALLIAADAAPARAQAPDPAPAASSAPADAFSIEAALATRLAYVVTGDQQVDEASRRGLEGLGKVLASRTALEPAEPMGVNVETDELTFFPILYWPVLDDAEPLQGATLAKIDAFMKQGGLIVFDTRDQQTNIEGMGQGGSPSLRRLIGQLDIPPLESAPPDHVLTKSFYLLRGFPGRYDGGALFVEASAATETERAERSRRADGVSSILITSNDFAGAWALDDRNRPLYPVVPGGETQREMAFRAGVNIVMYALTGNYKADQVHVPALLERLGQ